MTFAADLGIIDFLLINLLEKKALGNMFKEKRQLPQFDWSWLGDIESGRPNLGEDTFVWVYRLMQFTLRDALVTKYGLEIADEIFYSAGKKAGEEFFYNLMNPDNDFEEFVSQLQKLLKDYKIGLLRIEKADVEKLDFTITIAEDLDCSGLPFFDEQVCIYDEGFIAGILNSYTSKEFDVKEVDCWASGDRVCRFEAKVKS